MTIGPMTIRSIREAAAKQARLNQYAWIDPTIVVELLDRAESAEADVARLNGLLDQAREALGGYEDGGLESREVRAVLAAIDIERGSGSDG